jgi:hypothetical protein
MFEVIRYAQLFRVPRRSAPRALDKQPGVAMCSRRPKPKRIARFA